MLCCAVGVVAVATGAIGWRRFRRSLHASLTARSLLPASAAAAVVVTITVLSTEHFYAAHASGLELVSSDALCRGGDPTTNMATNED